MTTFNAYCELAAKIRTTTSPQRIILFGSAAADRFVEGSDLDLLLVFSDLATLRAGRLLIRSTGSLTTHCLVDLVFVTADHFDAKKTLGGICFTAEHDGIDL